MKRFIKNPKKGAAVELALLIIFVVVAMSSLIVSFSSMGSLKTKKSLEQLSASVTLDAVAEKYISEKSFTDGNGVSLTDYGVEGDEWSFVLTHTDSGQTLSVKLQQQGSSYIILEWKY